MSEAWGIEQARNLGHLDVDNDRRDGASASVDDAHRRPWWTMMRTQYERGELSGAEWGGLQRRLFQRVGTKGHSWNMTPPQTAMRRPRCTTFLPSVGFTAGRWTVLREAVPGLLNGHRRWLVLCRCACGNERLVPTFNLTPRGIVGHGSCGCLHKEVSRELLRTHGESHTRLYRRWYAMLFRCTNPADNLYRYYGGRGIGIDAAWQDFPSFRDWALSHGYKPELTLDRIDNDGDYGPNNCRWVSMLEQNNNKRNNHILLAFGERKTIGEWGRDARCKTTPHRIHHRITVGWPPERAITRPSRQKRQAEQRQQQERTPAAAQASAPAGESEQEDVGFVWGARAE